MLCNIRERGHAIVEYAILFALLAIVAAAALLIFGPMIGNVFSNMGSTLAAH